MAAQFQHGVYMAQTNKSYTTLGVFIVLAILGLPDQAFAVQTHTAPEGIYVHQFAHIFYIAALCNLFWDLRLNTFNSKGRKLLQFFCIFMILWNIVAFTSHTLAEFIDKSDLISQSGYLSTTLQEPFTSLKLSFYLAQFDHLFSVPALAFLFLSLRTLYRNSCEENQ
jgi:hypothetical protein